MDAQPKIGGFGCFKGALQIRRDEWYFLISRPNFGLWAKFGEARLR